MVRPDPACCGCPITRPPVFRLTVPPRPRRGNGDATGDATGTQRGLGRAPDVGDDEPACRQGGDPAEADPEILVRDVVVDVPGEDGQGCLHHLDGDPFPGAAVVRVMVVAALGDEVVSAAVPAAEAVGTELVGLIPQVGVVVGSV